MWETVLRRIQEKVREGNLVVTIHAEEEMDNDDLLLDDVTNAILMGEIHGRQRDHYRGWKYRI